MLLSCEERDLLHAFIYNTLPKAYGNSHSDSPNWRYWGGVIRVLTSVRDMLCSERTTKEHISDWLTIVSNGCIGEYGSGFLWAAANIKRIIGKK